MYYKHTQKKMQNIPADLISKIESAKSALKALQHEAKRIKHREADRVWKASKYNTDPEYRERVKARCLAIYHRKMAEKNAHPNNI